MLRDFWRDIKDRDTLAWAVLVSLIVVGVYFIFVFFAYPFETFLSSLIAFGVAFCVGYLITRPRQ